MAKRTAEKQLTQLNQFDEDVDTDGNGGEFRKADEATLARRVIKKPKSRLRGAAAGDPTAAATDSAAKTSVTTSTSGLFSNLGSFGSFTKPAAADGGSKGLFVGVSLQPSTGSKPTSTQFSFQSFGSTATAATTTSEEPSSTSTGGFTPSLSFGTTTTPAITTTTAAAIATPAPMTTTNGEHDNESKREYYRKLRGLNESFRSRLESTLKDDVFVDLSELFSQYTNYRKEIVEAYEKSKTKPNTESEPKPIKSEATSAGSLGGMENKATSTAASKPSSSIFGEPATIAATVPSIGGASLFGSSTPAPAAPAAPATTTTSSDDSSGQKLSFSFGFNTTKTTNSSGTSTFGSRDSVPPTTSSSLFGGTAASTTTTSGGSGFTLGSSLFGTPSATSTSAITTTTPQFPLSGFTTSSGNGSGSGIAITTTSGFGSGLFGSSATIPNPFSATSAGGVSEADGDNDQEEDEGNGEQEEADDKSAVTTESLNRKTAGEEDETTIHSVRCKIYKWDSNQNKYADRGIGLIKVNERSDDNGKLRARLLCRQEATSIITLNAAMYKSMPIEYNDTRDLGIVVVERVTEKGKQEAVDKPVKYMVRVKTPDMAKELYTKVKETLDKLQ